MARSNTKMTALKPFPYAGIDLKIGDEFQVEDEKHVDLLSNVKLAERKNRSSANGYKRRDMRAEEAPEVGATDNG